MRPSVVRTAAYPAWGPVAHVPVTSRRSALAGMALYAPCRPGPVAIHLLNWRLVSLFGPTAVIGRRRVASPHVPDEVQQALSDAWRAHIAPFDTAAILQRRQKSRSGVAALLMTGGRPVAFVKARRAPSSLPAERSALTMLHRRPLETFRAPHVIAHGDVLGWDWLALSSLPPVPHRPARRPPLKAIVAEIQDALLSHDLPAGAPPHWRPMHGDLAPWNLRQLGRSSVALLDWEDAAWGPPTADEVYYAATVSALTGRRPPPFDAEAVDFWTSRLQGRGTGDFDERIDQLLLDALNGMGSREQHRGSPAP